MKDLLRTYFIVILSLYIVTLILPGIRIDGGMPGILLAATTYGILEFFLRPILKVLFFPLHFITLSLSIWIIDFFLFFIWTLVVPGVHVSAGSTPAINVPPIRIDSIHLVYWQSLLVSGFALKALIKFIKWLSD